MTAVAPARPRPWWPAAVVAAVMAAGTAARWSCLGADGLTSGETALPWCYSDVVGLFQGRGLAADPMPYRDVLTEYPPLTGLQWWLAGLGSRTVGGFFLVTAAIQGAAGVVLVVVLQHAGVSRGRLLAVAVAPSLLLSGTTNWDLVAVALLGGGLVAAGVRAGDGRGAGGGSGPAPQRPVASGVLLGLGGLAKVFPLVAVPLLAWWAVRRGDRRWAGRHVAAAMGAVLVVQLPVAWWAPDGWASWIALTRDRPVDWDTIWYALQVVTGRPLGPRVADAAVAVAGLVGVIVILRVGARHGVDAWRLVLPVLAWLLVSGKVHSPQYSLWLLPLLALSRVPLPVVWAWLLADAAVVLTRFPFLAGQQGFEAGSGVPTLPYAAFAVPLAVRGALLVLIIATVLGPGRLRAPAARAGPDDHQPGDA